MYNCFFLVRATPYSTRTLRLVTTIVWHAYGRHRAFRCLSAVTAAMEITSELGRNREKIGEVHDKVSR